MMNPVNIIPYSTLGADDRGVTTEFPIERLGNAMFVFRKAGTISGNHYHKGIEPNKNPEILWILHGEINFAYRQLHEENWQELIVKAPSKIEINAGVWHTITAITDISMLELNSLEQHINDTFR